MSSDAMAAPAPTPAYPVRFDVDYPDHLSRLLNGFLFVKWLLAIPIFLLFYVLAAFFYLPIGAFFTILFRRKYPKWWFDALVGLLAYLERLNAYLLMLRDEYPALDNYQAVHLEVDYPQNLNRWLPMVKWILAIPHYVVLIILSVLADVVWLVAWVAIIFTGRFPRGLFNFIVGVQRWSLRVIAYSLLLLTDKYPPFSMK
jgi:hypothetical protein